MSIGRPEWIRPRWKEGVKWIITMVITFLLGMAAYWGCDVMTGLR